MSGPEGEQVEGVEIPQVPPVDEPGNGSETPDESSPTVEESSPGEPDAEPKPDPEAEHAKFLETYQPVITRLPQALADERAEQTAAEEAAKAAEAQAQAERDAVTQRQLEVQAEADAAAAAYKADHYPESA